MKSWKKWIVPALLIGMFSVIFQEGWSRRVSEAVNAAKEAAKEAVKETAKGEKAFAESEGRSKTDSNAPPD